MKFRNRKNKSHLSAFTALLSQQPHAAANIKGHEACPEISGCVRFWQTSCGVLVAAEVCGLPAHEKKCCAPVFAMHIHSGGSCGGNSHDSFSGSMGHYNPEDCKHPFHAGDLLPIMGNDGYGLSIFLTDRFSCKEIIGKTVIIHGGRDDFTSQPSGDSGEKIACGEIERVC
ncbi:MAG: superoxide dismutase family protein [Ruminococcus sp.]|nr:superoxide dismutase family protein [Ruminococcus sp.]